MRKTSSDAIVAKLRMRHSTERSSSLLQPAKSHSLSDGRRIRYLAPSCVARGRSENTPKVMLLKFERGGLQSSKRDSTVQKRRKMLAKFRRQEGCFYSSEK
ncbi:unnamed protein product [Bursaphelenchus okinawaensis]|uniref:Uncharacterized protein n=1 Tax=Bursaphelenchus okinawaensis TaxID=465554 RepID=A0A811KRA8_9BILA|nr:unnamed protein product [Bursaphelenchus okinawaensis]CAG9111379.1 unnamed protein product [Bursaphelenchus okinawaensis]